ncbi:MAG: amino acid transporter [Gammaproteobacteria bacterium RIFCSPHIGHO2_12_FULL_45_9]|nr:MAG: amino acid transporter [Gammaproteobacteria bacterium RIFCSPHIGHO2_12_FULL_45_9]
MSLSRLKTFFMGRPKNPLKPETRHHIALIAFLAWIGLGADGLSSSCYGPEESFLALGSYAHLAPYLALATAVTVFLIAFAYNQVIELFPSGGGGYKVATQLLGPRTGLISGCALVIDYVLTISLSIASGVDATFSLLPPHWQSHKLTVEIAILCFMTYLNIRGAKESIKILMPIFLGFFLSHIGMILWGLVTHTTSIRTLVPHTLSETYRSAGVLGWAPLIALLARAYSLGGGTYTGIEAVSNNVHILAEPRVRTGKWTMFYMAFSLSIVAGGIMMLYVVWGARPEIGKTLNAAVFTQMLANTPYQHMGLLFLMLMEAGILFVAANTGFLGGPAVLANMAIDSWAPKRFSALSNRLVTQNGIMFFTLAALAILIWSDGLVSLLVVLYSMNVFLTFSLTFAGLIRYHLKQRKKHTHTRYTYYFRFCFLALALSVSLSILLGTLIEKFTLGGWITVVITGMTATGGIYIRRHYRAVDRLKKKLDAELRIPLPSTSAHAPAPALAPHEPTAVFLVKGIGGAMHSLLWVLRMFPNHFKNILFISQGIVDIGSFGSEEQLQELQHETQEILDYLVTFCHQHHLAAESRVSFGTDPVRNVDDMIDELNTRFPNALYFASRYVYPKDNWITRLLHSNFATMIQKRLHHRGLKMLILPLNLKI